MLKMPFQRHTSNDGVGGTDQLPHPLPPPKANDQSHFPAPQIQDTTYSRCCWTLGPAVELTHPISASTARRIGSGSEGHAATILELSWPPAVYRPMPQVI